MIDTELEAAIDEAGRDRVFAIVRASGWTSGDSVPKYVWWDAVRLAAQNPQPEHLIVGEARPGGFKSLLGQ